MWDELSPSKATNPIIGQIVPIACKVFFQLMVDTKASCKGTYMSLYLTLCNLMIIIFFQFSFDLLILMRLCGCSLV
jgi:hypothetical protein